MIKIGNLGILNIETAESIVRKRILRDRVLPTKYWDCLFLSLKRETFKSSKFFYSSELFPFCFLNIYHIKIDLTKYTKQNTYTFHFLIKRQSIKITKKNPNIFYKITPPLWIIQLRLPPQGGGGPCPHAPVLHTGMLGSLGLEVGHIADSALSTTRSLEVFCEGFGLLLLSDRLKEICKKKNQNVRHKK